MTAGPPSAMSSAISDAPPTTFRRKDGQIAPVRKTATPDDLQAEIYQAIHTSPHRRATFASLGSEDPTPSRIVPRPSRRQAHSSCHDKNSALYGLTQIHTTLKMG